MGVVWRAIDERLERSVAVKQILAQPGLSPAERDNVRQRAMREAKNAARFQHPNAIVVFDIAEHEGDPCLVMEYLPSRSLSAVLAERPTLDLPHVASIGKQVASALVVAHRAGIVHRDIKPGNILIDENGTAKITDFGISRAAGDLTLTQTGLIGGTPAYLAPELARGSDPTPASDVFSLGATLYHALEGQPPYGNSANQLALLYTAANGQVIPPKQAGQATALLMSLLRSEPEERPSMLEARQRLASLAYDHPSSPGTLASPPLYQPGRQPAAVDSAPAEPPPWKRTENNGAATPPPRTPTAAFVPSAAKSAAPAPAAKSSNGMDGKRKAILGGSVAAVVAVVAVVVFLILNSSGGGDTPPQETTGPSYSAAPSQSQSSPSSKPPAALGKTPSSGSVIPWGAAGQTVEKFYDLPQSASASWNLLTPAAQQVYGSFAEFQQYWSARPVDGFRGIAAANNSNNPDGSVDMRLASLTYGGQTKQVILRVIDAGGGKLLIDSDTK